MITKYTKKLRLVLNNFDINYSVSLLEKELLTNPNHNNFFGLSQILEKFGLRTIAKKVDFNESFNLHKPFIAQIIDPEEICSISIINNQYIKGIDENGKGFKYKTSSFQKRWVGYVLEPIPPFNPSKKLSINKFLNFLNLNSEICLLSFLVVFFIKNLIAEQHYFFNTLLFLINFTGLIISYQLLKIKFSNNQNKFCKIIKNGDCSSIINSTKFLNLIDYDKIGIVYFLFFCTIPLISSYQKTGISLLAISVISALFPFYSIYYQKYVMKTWCLLCLVVQFLLIMNFLVVIFNYEYFSSFQNGVLDFIFIFILVVVVSGYYLQSNNLQIKYSTSQKRLNEFIKNQNIFDFLGKKNVEYFPIDNSSKIIIGPETENIITLVTNPFCRYCESAYNTIKDLVFINQNYRLNIIYLAGSNETSKNICEQFISIYFIKGEKFYLEAVRQWYIWGFKNYDKWQNMYALNPYENTKVILSKHENWATDHKINSTPTILLNGKIIPKEYEINELNYF